MLENDISKKCISERKNSFQKSNIYFDKLAQSNFLGYLLRIREKSVCFMLFLKNPGDIREEFVRKGKIPGAFR